MPAAAWSSDQLTRIDAADELLIAVRRPDGTVQRRVPIWVFRVGEQVLVRTWLRREDGWFGRVLQTRRAWIGVPGFEADVAVQDVGNDMIAELRTAVDTAYRAKYGRYGVGIVGRMVTDEAAATTLRLIPEQSTPSGDE